jgi:hypothetical protein
MQVPFVCLWCERKFGTSVRVMRHSCAAKREAEARLAVKLSRYDPIARAIEIERDAEARRRKQFRL